MEYLSVTDAGAKCNGVAIDDVPINRALAYAAARGLMLHVPCSSAVKNIVIPAWGAPGSQGGFGIEFDPGVVWYCHNNDGSDCVSQTARPLGYSILTIIGMSLNGPGSGSGNGLRIDNGYGNPVAIQGLWAQNFHGTGCTVTGEVSGCAGLWIASAEDGSLRDINLQNNAIDLRLDNQFDANSIENLIVGQSDLYGIVTYLSSSLDFRNVVVQSNKRVGFFSSDVGAATYTNVHFENNNASAVPGLATVQIDCSPSIHNANAIFIGTQWVGPREKLVFTKSGTPCANGSIWIGGRASAITAGSVDVAAAPSQVFINAFTAAQLTGKDATTLLFPDVEYPQQLQLNDGAARTPTYSFGDDSTTGTFREINKLSFSVGGVRQGYLDNFGLQHLAGGIVSSGLDLNGGFTWPGWSLIQESGTGSLTLNDRVNRVDQLKVTQAPGNGSIMSFAGTIKSGAGYQVGGVSVADTTSAVVSGGTVRCPAGQHLTSVSIDSHGVPSGTCD
jgi:hypothetical protein